MAFTPTRPGSGGRPTGKLRLRASHSSKLRLRVSHRADGWRPPGKDDDALYERDLLPQPGRPAKR
jgi:hypothetical protein